MKDEEGSNPIPSAIAVSPPFEMGKAGTPNEITKIILGIASPDARARKDDKGSVAD